MSTQTEIDSTILESLEFSPACEGKAHYDKGIPATHWAEIHSCREGFLCWECLDAFIQRIRPIFLHPMPKCELCKQIFHTLGDFMTFFPLKG